MNGSVSQTGAGSGTSERRVVAALQEYLALVEAGTPPDRSQFLARHADIAELLSDCLEGLTLVQAAAPSLSHPQLVADAAELDGPAADRLLGDFRLLRELGRGGMGVVYEAEQVSLLRRVALKVLPFAAVLDQRALKRFHNEALAAAQLEHPHIVSVYGVGCERGVHYYAMRLVDGPTLADVIKQLQHAARHAGRSPDSLAELVASSRPDIPVRQVESAGQPARSAPSGPADEATEDYPPPRTAPGVSPLSPRSAAADPRSTPDAPLTIPHQQAELSTWRSFYSPAFFRSIATFGIQVAEALAHAHALGIVHRDIKPSNLMLDAGGHAWVTDFGLAHVEANPSLTAPGDLLGTLRYMSPEQADGSHAGIDHRIDVYALGVTLYELVTLRPAFTGESRQELLRQISVEEPPAPRRVNSAVPLDLETIIQKAMAKEPGRRYDSCGSLAEDLRRYLADRPIQARRPGFGDRTVKWLRRHPAITRLTAAFLVVGMVGLSVATWLVWLQGQETKAALAEANWERKAAQQAVDDMYTGVAEKLLNERPHMKQLEREFLEKALGYYELEMKRVTSDPAVRLRAADASLRVGRIRRSLGAYDAAEAAHRRSIDLLQGLERDSPDTVRLQLANSHYRLAQVLADRGRSEEAEENYRRALALYDAFPADSTAAQSGPGLCYIGIADVTAGHGDVHVAQGCRKAAEWFQKAATRWPDQPGYRLEWANALNILGKWFYKSGGISQAHQAWRECRQVLELLVEQSPTARHREELLMLLSNLGVAETTAGNHEPALECLRRSIERGRRMAEDFPEVPDYQWQLGTALLNLGVVLKTTAPEESGQARQEAAAVMERLTTRFPDRVEYRLVLAKCLRNVGNFHRDTGNYPQADIACGRALELYSALASEFPANAEYQVGIADCHYGLAKVHQKQGRQDAALQDHEAALAVRIALADSFPDQPQRQMELASAYSQLGLMDFESGKPVEGERKLRAALKIWEKLAEQSRSPAMLAGLAASYVNLGAVTAAEGRREESLSLWCSGLDVAKGLMSEEPHVVEHRLLYTKLSNNIGMCLNELNRPNDALKALEAALEVESPILHAAQNSTAWFLAHAPAELFDPARAVILAELAVKSEPNKAAYWNTLGAAQYRAGQYEAAVQSLNKSIELGGGGGEDYIYFALAEAQQQHLDEARRWYEKAQQWMRDHPPSDELTGFAQEAAALLVIDHEQDAGNAP